VKNAITGICIFSFAVGVFAFTLRAVGQENFEDVVVPDAPMVADGEDKRTRGEKLIDSVSTGKGVEAKMAGSNVNGMRS
jgi:hypothetical protein